MNGSCETIVMWREGWQVSFIFILFFHENICTVLHWLHSSTESCYAIPGNVKEYLNVLFSVIYTAWLRIGETICWSVCNVWNVFTILELRTLLCKVSIKLWLVLCLRTSLCCWCFVNKHTKMKLWTTHIIAYEPGRRGGHIEYQSHNTHKMVPIVFPPFIFLIGDFTNT